MSAAEGARALWTKGERAEGTGPRQLGRAEGNKKRQAGLGCAGLVLGEKLGRAREERERRAALREGAGPGGLLGPRGKRRGAGLELGFFFFGLVWVF